MEKFENSINPEDLYRQYNGIKKSVVLDNNNYITFDKDSSNNLIAYHKDLKTGVAIKSEVIANSSEVKTISDPGNIHGLNLWYKPGNVNVIELDGADQFALIWNSYASNGSGKYLLNIASFSKDDGALIHKFDFIEDFANSWWMKQGTDENIIESVVIDNNLNLDVTIDNNVHEFHLNEVPIDANYPILSFDRGVDENLSNIKYHDGHFYQLGSAPMNYADAKAFAESQELYGQKGYLVNINDLAEQDFLYANFFNNDSNQNGLANYTPTEFWATGMKKK